MPMMSNRIFHDVFNVFCNKQNHFYRASMSYGYYGLTFGIQNMAGNMYLNMFLVNIIELPANCLAMYAVNRYECSTTRDDLKVLISV